MGFLFGGSCSPCCAGAGFKYRCLKFKTSGWEGRCVEYGWIYNDSGYMQMTVTLPPANSNTLGCRNNSNGISDSQAAARLDFWLAGGTANVMLYEGTRRLNAAGGTDQIHYTTSDPAVIAALASGQEVDVSAWSSSITQPAPRAIDGRSYIDTVGTVSIRLDGVREDAGFDAASAQYETCNCGFYPGAFLPTCASNGTPIEECYKDLPETFTLQFQSSAFSPVSAGGMRYSDINEASPVSSTKHPWMLPPGDVVRFKGLPDQYNAGGCDGYFLDRFKQPIVMRRTLTGRDTTYVSDPLPLRPCTKILFKLTVHKGTNYTDRRASLTSTTTTTSGTGSNFPVVSSGLRAPGFACQWDKDYWADNPGEHVKAFNEKSYSFFHGRITATPGGVYMPETIAVCPATASGEIDISYSSNCGGKVCPPSEYIVRLSQATVNSWWASPPLFGDYYVSAEKSSRYCRPKTGFREWVFLPRATHTVDSSNFVYLELHFGYHPGSTYPPVPWSEDGCGCGQAGPFLRMSGQANGTGFSTNVYALPAVPAGWGEMPKWAPEMCVEHCRSTEKVIDFGDVKAQVGTAFPNVFNVQVIVPAVLP